MKKKIIAVILLTALCAACFSGCGIAPKNVTKLTIYQGWGDAADTQAVYEEINKTLREKLNAELDVKFTDPTNFSLLFSSGEVFDLISVPDYYDFWSHARSGAFAEITDEDLKTNAPEMWKIGQKWLQYGSYQGKRIAIPGFWDTAPNSILIVRGDLMKKYGIEKIEGMEDLEKYLSAVAENEPDMIPYDVSGGRAYTLPAMYFPDLGWISPGTVSFASHVYVDTTKNDNKVFITLETEEGRDFTRKMKEWNEKGFFSQTALANTVDPVDSFKNGRSALAWGTGVEQLDQMWREFQQDDRKDWDVQGYPFVAKYQCVMNYVNTAMSVSATSKHKDLALKVLNELITNQELYMLWNYGIKDQHYTMDDEGYIQTINADRFIPQMGIKNEAFNPEVKLEMPGAEELKAKLKELEVSMPIVNMENDLSEVKEIVTAMNNVYEKYSMPRFLGFVDDPDKAIEDELKALKDAGIDRYVEVIQEKVDQFVSEQQ